MEDLTEVITSAQFHPNHCHIMLHSSSKGTIKVRVGDEGGGGGGVKQRELSVKGFQVKILTPFHPPPSPPPPRSATSAPPP